MPDGSSDHLASPDEDAAREAAQAAELAREAEEGAEKARDDAQQARAGAVDAGAAAVTAAAAVAPPDDPLLDTAARRIEAQVTEDRPFGVPGRPIGRRSPFRVAFSASMGVAVAAALVLAVVAVRSVLVLLLTAAFLAIGLDPAVQALERRGFRRSLAVGAVLVGVLLVFAGFLFAIVPPIAEQVQQFSDKAPHYLDQLRGNGRIASLDARYHVLDQAQQFLDDPSQLGARVFGGLFGVGKVVFGALLSALTVLILTLYFLANLPDIKAQAYRLVPRSRRARVGLLADEILSRIGGYVGGALVIAVFAGVSTFVVLEIVGVPYPVPLAIIVAITDLIPLVGATIGAALVTGLALFTNVRSGIVVGGFFLAYQQLENYVIYPRVMKRSVDVSPASAIVAVLVGGSLLGVLGALLAIPTTAAVQLVLAEVLAPRQDAT